MHHFHGLFPFSNRSYVLTRQTSDQLQKPTPWNREGARDAKKSLICSYIPDFRVPLRSSRPGGKRFRFRFKNFESKFLDPGQISFWFFSKSSGKNIHGNWQLTLFAPDFHFHFLHIPFAALMKFWTRLRPRSLARENSANSGREVRFEHLALRASALVIAGCRQFTFALRDASLGQDVCPKIS